MLFPRFSSWHGLFHHLWKWHWYKYLQRWNAFMLDSSVLDYYTAGIIDGEGTITLTIKKSALNNRNFRMPVVSVSSTTLEILTFLKENYGGHISSHKIYKDHHKQSWSWKLTYNDAIDLCEKIHPLLLEPEKRRRAKMLVTEYRSVTKRNGRYTESDLEAKHNFQERFLHPSAP